MSAKITVRDMGTMILILVLIITLGYQNYTLREINTRLATSIISTQQEVSMYVRLVEVKDKTVTVMEHRVDQLIETIKKRDEFYIDALKKSCEETYL